MARWATNRFIRSAFVGGTLVVAVTGAGCFGSGRQNAGPSTQALPPPSTVATYAGQAKTCPRPTSYVPKLSPTHGSAGSRAVITGTLPLYGENGKLDASSTAELVGWWNLKFAARFRVAEKPPRPVSAKPGPVFRILVVSVPTPNPCTYKLYLRVPNVADGTYTITILDFGGRSVSSFAPITFTVTEHTHQPSGSQSVTPVAGVALLPVIRPVRLACNRLAQTKSVRVLCPTILPRPATTHPATPIGVYRFPVCHALVRPARCPLYDLAIMYGAPDEPPTGDGGHNPPATFLHFEMLGGRYVGEALSLHGLSGTVPLQRLIGRRTITGHHGLLYFGLPYQHGGGEYGSHYTFIWPQGRWRYAASLHSWKPHAATLRVLTALIASLAPVTSR